MAEENGTQVAAATYTTSRGYQIEFLSIPNLMVKLSAQFPEPTAPTYSVQVAGGGTEVHVHNETTLETEADKFAWAEYQTSLAKRASELFQAQLRLCLLRGIKVLNADVEELQAAWVAEQELIGFHIPTEPNARRLHWLETEIVNDNEDFIQILTGVSRASGIQEEAVSNLEASFRSAMGRKGRHAVAVPADSSNGQTMVAELPIRANGHSRQKRNSKTQRVGRAVQR